MPKQSWFSRQLAAFRQSRNGNFAITFALVLTPIMLCAGAAVDYSRISDTRTRMQDAADTAALTAAIERNKSKSERKQIARDMFDANYNGTDIRKFSVDFDSDQVTVRVKTTLNMSLMRIAGYKNIDVAVESSANLDMSELEVALVLDISGSMLNSLPDGTSRIDALRQASLKLVDSLEKKANGKSKIAVVPFTMNVNIGTSNSSMATGTNDPLFAGSKWLGCVQEDKPPYHIADKPKSKLQAYIWPPAPDGTTASGGFCKNRSNGTNTGYANLEEASNLSSKSAYFDGPNRNCVRFPIEPLTDRFNDVRNTLNALESHGNDGTIIAPGVTWGLRVLSPAWPFKEGNAWNKNNYKYMIVITDGAQTTEIEYQDQTCNTATNSGDPYEFDPANFGMGGKKLSGQGPVDNWTPYGYILDSDPFQDHPGSVYGLPDTLQKLSLDACTEAKKQVNGAGIEIFTIGVSSDTAPGTKVYDLLHSCASAPENHFYVTDKDSVDKAFDAITNKVLKLRLTN
ncbi:MAG: TadE/TadG family protein [Nitratireductor sp.]|nr:TadE/TadG family protein [Nitratireductor sp.]